MKLRDDLRLPPLELLLQELPEEVVIAVAPPVPPTSPMSWFARASDRSRAAARAARHGLGDLRLDDVEDRAPGEEGHVVEGEARQDLGRR